MPYAREQCDGNHQQGADLPGGNILLQTLLRCLEDSGDSTFLKWNIIHDHPGDSFRSEKDQRHASSVVSGENEMVSLVWNFPTMRPAIYRISDD